MIYKNTIIHVGDNSGPKKAKSLNIKKKKIGFLAYILVVAVKKKLNIKKKLKKNILNSIILTSKKKNKDGETIINNLIQDKNLILYPEQKKFLLYFSNIFKSYYDLKKLKSKPQ